MRFQRNLDILSKFVKQILLKQKDAVAVIDYSNARKKALECELKITGTLGLLYVALEKQIISRSELKNILNDLRIKDDFRISDELMKNYQA